MKRIFVLLFFLLTSITWAQNEVLIQYIDTTATGDEKVVWVSIKDSKYLPVQLMSGSGTASNTTAKSGWAWIGTTPERLTTNTVNVVTVIPNTSGINLFFNSDSSTLSDTTGTQLAYLQPVTFTTDNLDDWWWMAVTDSIRITWFGEK